MKKKIYFYLALIFNVIMGIGTTGCQNDVDENSKEYIKHKLNDEIINLPSGEFVEKKNGNIYYEGDIILTERQLDNLIETGTIAGNNQQIEPVKEVHPATNLPLTSSTRNVGLYPTGYNLWAMVRFTYDSNLSTTHRERIKTALLRIQSNTNVRFYNATGQPTHDDIYDFDYPYVNFKYIGDEDTSYSYIGRIGGKQDICLADFAFESYNTHVIEHEICHALGLLHEQCRYDRDNYVSINTSNLTEKGLANFTKRTSNYTCRGSYDFNSIMGYDSYTSSTSVVINTNLPMYTKLDGTNIYQGRELSDGDRMWLNYYYLPYVARSDTYAELDSVVFDGNNQRLSEEQRIQLQAQLNNGTPLPPEGGRITNEF